MSHETIPRLMSAQNRRALDEDFLKLTRTAAVAQKRIMFWRMSPKAASGKPRGAKSDNKTCTHKTAHTTMINCRRRWSGVFPTLQIVCKEQSLKVLPK